jgi:hypothetical protein
VTNEDRASAQRGAKRRAATEQALPQAWECLRAGVPSYPDLVSGGWQLSVRVAMSTTSVPAL